MKLRHTNPTRARRDRAGHEMWARAPYNFVPLPEKIVPAREPVGHDAYHDGTLTGWIDCELETCSPVYVRGMFSEAEFEAQGNKGPDELTPEERDRRAPFFATDEAKVEGRPVPVIPGSSLRGMIRTLVEIAGYGRMRWVAKEPTFTFRAVAASRDDPLRDPYQDVLGRLAANVQAGYLEKRGDDWYVRPAQAPQAMGWPERAAYLKVKERQIQARDIPGYLRLDSPNYRPQLHQVSFDVEVRDGQRGRYAFVSRIGSGQAGYRYQGMLVCSGNMLETGKGDQRSPRKGHALVLPPDPKAKVLKIRRQAIEDYRAGMTPFQRDELKDWAGGQWGCLKQGAPVFYVTEGDEVAYFGHSPNFRIPARLFGSSRAATPLDFVPEALRTETRPDLADAIFGWVEEKGSGLEGQRAGRVSFSDARFVGAANGVWLGPEPIVPRTLGGPKPTTFQHYLVQDRDARHDPDDKASLAHYGTSPDQTQIRGHKLYWHKGASPEIEASAKEREHEKQLTRIVPVRPGVRFSFRIHFENLREEELGALCWALALPGETGRIYRHKLGMGKPLGMGAIAITPHLCVTDRLARYRQLFGNGRWAEAATPAEAQSYLDAFETYILKAGGIASDRQHLCEVERIQMLLTLLEWREGAPDWIEATRYMEIEHGADRINEYKDRPVLPDPLVVVAGLPVRPPALQGQARESRPETSGQAGREQGKPSQKAEASSTRTGTIKWFKADRGYGFIAQEDGTDVFVHQNNVVGRVPLRQGQRVRYRVGPGMKGPEAKNVEQLE